MGWFLPVLATVAANVIGGALSRKDSGKPTTEQTTTTSDVRYNFAQTRADAEAAGYNPLTALRAVGAGYTTTSNGVTTITPPKMSMASVVGNAIVAGGNVFSQYYKTPMEKKREQMEMDLLAKELAYVPPRMAGGTTRQTSGGDLPRTRKIGLYIDVYDQMTGRWIRIPDPELTESSPAEMAGGLSILGGADTAQNLLGFGNPGDRQGSGGMLRFFGNRVNEGVYSAPKFTTPQNPPRASDPWVPSEPVGGW